MKTIKYILALLTVVTAMACSKDDASEIPKEGIKPPIETPANKAPATFDLIDVADSSNGIDLKPTFTWNAAVDPEGDAVTYDFFLDEQEDPTTLIGANLTEPTFATTDSLHLVTDYHWKIVAKDTKGASVSSAVNFFTTRILNFPDDPITDNADFSERYGHSMVAFNGSLWIIGGYVDGEYTNDVWQSRNGESWRKVTPDYYVRDLFQKRGFHTTVIFDNKLWVIGGIGVDGFRNDVWYSTDGASWTEATPNAQFSPRSAHTTVVFQNKLWVIGGNVQDFHKTNDVWSSSDGINWTQEIISADFSPRSNHATVVFDNKLWIIGGYYENIVDDQDHRPLNDVWSTTDGQNWTEVTSNAEFPPFSGASEIVFDNKIMLLGVEDEHNPAYDIWYSKDGKIWSSMTPGDYYPFLGNLKAAVLQNKIWINNDESKEIWALD